MMERDEEFIHFHICINRFVSAWNTLKEVKANLAHPLVGSAFRFALVEYAIPYSKSEGEHKRSGHRLKTTYIPDEFMALHNRLLAARNKVHAHADLTLMSPTLSFIELDGQRLATVSGKHVDELEELRNIDEIILLIEATLHNMFNDVERRKGELRP